MTYEIRSERLGEVGETVTDEELKGLNVEALLEGGFLVPIVDDANEPASPED